MSLIWHLHHAASIGAFALEMRKTAEAFDQLKRAIEQESAVRQVWLELAQNIILHWTNEVERRAQICPSDPRIAERMGEITMQMMRRDIYHFESIMAKARQVLSATAGPQMP